MSGYAPGLGSCPPMPPGFVNPNCSGNCPPGMCWTGHCDTTRNPVAAICEKDSGYTVAAMPITPLAVVPAPAVPAPAPTVMIAPVQTTSGPATILELIPEVVGASTPAAVAANPTPRPYAQCPSEYPYGYLNPQGELVCLHAQDGAQAAPLPAGQASPVGAPIDTSTGYVAPDAVATPPSWWTDPAQALVDSIPNLYAVPIAAGLLYFVVKGMGKR